MAKRKTPQTKPARKAANKRTNCNLLMDAGSAVIGAKSILLAARAAHDSESLEGENYDIHYPLSAAIELLERASAMLGEVAHG